MNFLHSLWLSRVQESHSATAIEDVSGIYSYAQLAQSAKAWREQLQSVGLRQGDRLVLVADTSFDAISVLIGCSMAGVVFTVISPEVPAARREAIVDDLDPALILLDTKAPDLVEHGHSLALDMVAIRFAMARGVTSGSSAATEATELLTEDPAYIVFTSGSTGKPKGIVMSHRAIVSFWQGLIAHLQLSANKRYASFSPLQFDFALLDIGACLGSGATLVLPNRNLLRKPKELINQLAASGITHFSGVPTIWKLMLKSAPDAICKLNTLERILFAGEHFPAEHMCKIHDALPDVDFYNIYGQSESIACTFQVLTSADFRSDKPHMPVGQGHQDMALLLLDDDGKPVVCAGQMGELYIRGSTLFSGYWRNPEQTAARLVQNPTHQDFVDTVFRTGDMCYRDEAGVYFFVGRKDNQIKIHGNRVELEEIEAALNRYPGVSNSCVIVSGPAKDVLHAAVTPCVDHTAHTVDLEDALRAFLAADLPAYMLPRHYHFMSDIPVSANGKNDRKLLARELEREVA